MVFGGWPSPGISAGLREPLQSIPSCGSLPSSSSSSLLHTPMAPIHRFSAEEKGKAPREGPNPLPPKKRPVLYRRDEGALQEASRPWYERPPPGFPLPLFARVVGLGGEGVERHQQRRRRHRRVTVVRI